MIDIMYSGSYLLHSDIFELNRYQDELPLRSPPFIRITAMNKSAMLRIRDELFEVPLREFEDMLVARGADGALPQRYELEFVFGSRIYSYGEANYHDLFSTIVTELEQVVIGDSHNVLVSGYPLLRAEITNEWINFFEMASGKKEVGRYERSKYQLKLIDILARLENIRFFNERRYLLEFVATA